jgi:hypothetical protein
VPCEPFNPGTAVLPLPCGLDFSSGGATNNCLSSLPARLAVIGTYPQDYERTGSSIVQDTQGERSKFRNEPPYQPRPGLRSVAHSRNCIMGTLANPELFGIFATSGSRPIILEAALATIPKSLSKDAGWGERFRTALEERASCNCRRVLPEVFSTAFHSAGGCWAPIFCVVFCLVR